MRRALLAAAAAILLAAPAAIAAPQGDCKPQAIRDLERLSPHGHAIYTAIKDKDFFMRWITCDDVQLGLATAVHESVHYLTEEKNAYLLLDGSTLKREPAFERFYPPREIARRFNGGSTYVQTYLKPGAASSSSDFTFLLDEMNAYSHDLNSAVRLHPLNAGGAQVDHRDGLTALMAFVTAYVDNAKKAKPATWQGLQKPEAKHVLQTLWKQAETVVSSSCGIPGIGVDDRKYIGQMCDANQSGALSELLGRPVECASACLQPSTASSGATVTR